MRSYFGQELRRGQGTMPWRACMAQTQLVHEIVRLVYHKEGAAQRPSIGLSSNLTSFNAHASRVDCLGGALARPCTFSMFFGATMPWELEALTQAMPYSSNYNPQPNMFCRGVLYRKSTHARGRLLTHTRIGLFLTLE